MADTLSFSDIRAKHAECLRLCNQAAISPELIADIRKFVEDVRLAGRDIVDDDDREYLRSLLEGDAMLCKVRLCFSFVPAEDDAVEAIGDVHGQMLD